MFKLFSCKDTALQVQLLVCQCICVSVVELKFLLIPSFLFCYYCFAKSFHVDTYSFRYPVSAAQKNLARRRWLKTATLLPNDAKIMGVCYLFANPRHKLGVYLTQAQHIANCYSSVYSIQFMLGK